jgi:hypothetical protein
VTAAAAWLLAAGVAGTVAARVEKAFKGELEPDCFLSEAPCLLEGDFDGDRKKDEAVLVRQKKGGKRGIAVLHGRGASHRLGAGRTVGNGGDDFSWLEVWRLVPKDAREEGAPPARKGDLLYVGQAEGASAYLYWSGRSWKWRQAGD